MEFRYKGQALGGTTALSQGLTTYSEEETVIGTYLGKPLYRKIIVSDEFAVPAMGAASNVIEIKPSSLTTIPIDKGVEMTGYIWTKTHSGSINEYVIPNGWIDVLLDPSNKRFVISNEHLGTVSMTCKLYAVISYTKTTDPEGTVTPLPINCVQDYDTEDGWHVRKYSDGYVEMTHISGFSVEKSDFHDWGSAVSYDDLIAPLDLPVPLLDKFYESGSIMRSVPNSLIAIPRNTAADIDMAKTSGYGVFNMNRSGLGDQISGTFSILVTGRWK